MTGEQLYALYVKLRRDRGFYHADWEKLTQITKDVWERMSDYMDGLQR
jgi:hypothetical protein